MEVGEQLESDLSTEGEVRGFCSDKRKCLAAEDKSRTRLLCDSRKLVPASTKKGLSWGVAGQQWAWLPGASASAPFLAQSKQKKPFPLYERIG